MKNVFCVWMIVLLCCYGCKKEEDFDFVNPSIRMEGVEVLSDNQGELDLKITLGAGFKGHKAWVQLTDISETTGGSTTRSISLTEEVTQVHTLTVTPPVAGHDYQVMAVLETEKNRFETDKQYMFFSKKSHRYDVTHPYVRSADSVYDTAFLEGFVYTIAQPGGAFLVYLGNQSAFSVDEMKLMLNGEIQLECEYNKEIKLENETVVGRLPADLAPGDYSVQLYLDGEKRDVEGLVRILPWKSEVLGLKSDHPFSYFSVSASFVAGDEIVYVQFLDRNYIESYSEFKVFSYHIPTQAWTAKKTWIPADDGNPLMGISVGGKGYSVLQHNYKARLWSYSPESDEWQQVSDYPGKGCDGFVLFSIDDYIYMGGGVSRESLQHDPVEVNDFWRFNLQTQEWEQLGDLPFTPVDRTSINSTCIDGQKAYTFFYDRTLWSYDAMTASWSQEETLLQGPYFRYFAPICMWEGKVCLIGGEFDFHNLCTDIQLYDPESRQWSLKEIYRFQSHMSSSYIPAVHQLDGSIYVGPLQSRFEELPKFLKITPQ